MAAALRDPRLVRLSQRLAARPAPPATRAAAVAVLLRPDPHGLSVLLIERARQPGRRWSGDVALPGGLSEPGDSDLEATARRELAEEVGVTAGALVGQLAPRRTVTPRGWRSLSLTPFVFEAPPALAPLRLQTEEVADAFWVPTAALRRRRRWAVRRVAGAPLPFPERHLAGRRVWGLTLSILEALSRALDLAVQRP